MKKSCNIQKVLLVNKSRNDNKLFEKAMKTVCPEAELLKSSSIKKALDVLQKDKIDSIFIDYSQSKDDVDFFAELKKTNIFSHVIALINEGDELEAAEAIKDGAYDYIIKDGDYIESLPGVVERIKNVFTLKKEKEEELERQSFLFKQIFKSQKWWQNVIDSITDYLFVIDSQYRILRTNKTFASLFGKEPADIIMTPYYELFGMKVPHDWCDIPGGSDGFASNSVERKVNDTEYLISYYPIYFDDHEAVVYIMKDITETRRLKDQVFHLDKLSSLGTLTSGVAHEINNPLTGIIGYTEMLLMQEKEDTNKKYLKNVYDSAIRCKRIVENMLTFSRQTPAQTSPEDINDIIDKTTELHEYWLRSTNIEIVKNYDKVPYIDIDRQQTQQVILNLLINAEHSIADTERRGRIELSTKNVEEEKTVIVKVSDNGKGIPREVLSKIFDPFFTTKPVNKGTGLGLSIAHGIIAEQGGTIEVNSVEGEGATFTIKFPYSN